MIIQADLTLKQFDTVWTERYYLNPPEEPLFETLSRLALARFPILNTSAALVSGRCFRLDQHLFPYVRRFNWVGTWAPVLVHQTVHNIYAGFLPSWDVASIFFISESGARRTVFVGGVPNFPFGTGAPTNQNVVHVTLLGKLNDFRDALLAKTLDLQIREIVPGAGAQTAPIDRIDVAANGLYRLHLRSDFPVTTDDQVRVIGSRGGNLTRLRGLRNVTRAESARTIVLDRGPLAEKGPIRYTGGATLKETVYRYTKAAWLPWGMGPNVVVKAPLFPFNYFNPVVFSGTTIPYSLGPRRRGAGQPQKRGRARAR